MTRISKKVREEAAMIASIAACSGTTAIDCFSGSKPYDLYFLAWNYAHRCFDTWIDALDPIIDAEAESLLRCGWSPK